MALEKLVDPNTPKDNRGPLIGGIVLIAIGIYFLLERYNILPPFRTSWPVILIVAGGAMIIGYLLTRIRQTK